MLPPPRHILVVLLAVLLIVLSYMGGMLVGAEPASGSRLEVLPERSSGSRKSTGVMVDVGGAVRTPGVYEVAQGARVLDAIRRAGGALAEADLNLVNQAQLVVDGQQIVVPARGPVGAGGSQGSVAGGPVSINAGTMEQLDTLTGIGPATAAAIVDDRTSNGPFASVEELDRVAGIGPATIARLKEQVTL